VYPSTSASWKLGLWWLAVQVETAQPAPLEGVYRRASHRRPPTKGPRTFAAPSVCRCPPKRHLTLSVCQICAWAPPAHTPSINWSACSTLGSMSPLCAALQVPTEWTMSEAVNQTSGALPWLCSFRGSACRTPWQTSVCSKSSRTRSSRSEGSPCTHTRVNLLEFFLAWVFPLNPASLVWLARACGVACTVLQQELRPFPHAHVGHCIPRRMPQCMQVCLLGKCGRSKAGYSLLILLRGDKGV